MTMAKDKLGNNNSDQLQKALEGLEKALQDWDHIQPEPPPRSDNMLDNDQARELLLKLKKQLQTF